MQFDVGFSRSSVFGRRKTERFYARTVRKIILHRLLQHAVSLSVYDAEALKIVNRAEVELPFEGGDRFGFTKSQKAQFEGRMFARTFALRFDGDKRCG